MQFIKIVALALPALVVAQPTGVEVAVAKRAITVTDNTFHIELCGNIVREYRLPTRYSVKII